MSVAAEVLAELGRKNLTLATCESLTGGLIGAELTTVPGASKVYRGGFITYASDLKTSLVGVSAEHVRDFGVINAYTAEQMAAGAAEQAASDVALAVTGVAGPDPQDGNPPGVVWVGYSICGRRGSRQLSLSGERDEIRAQTTQQALLVLLEELGGS